MAPAALVVDASALVDVELLSVLRRLVLTSQLAEQQALLALDTAQLLGLRRHTTRQLWPRAWQLRTNLSAYDALYVALAAWPGLLDCAARCACRSSPRSENRSSGCSRWIRARSDQSDQASCPNQRRA